MDHILFIHLSVDGHLGCFLFWATMNNAVMNICVHFFVKVWLFSDSAALLNTGDTIAT